LREFVGQRVNIESARTELLTPIAIDNTIENKDVSANHSPKVMHQMKPQHCSSAGLLPNLRVKIIPIGTQSSPQKTSQRSQVIVELFATIFSTDQALPFTATMKMPWQPHRFALGKGLPVLLQLLSLTLADAKIVVQPWSIQNYKFHIFTHIDTSKKTLAL